MKKQTFKVCSIYDTETTNYGSGNESRAFPVLYIFNDIRGVELPNYTIGESDDIHFYRDGVEVFAYLYDLIEFGINNDIVPIIASYNLSFDLQPLIYDLSEAFSLRITAQASTTLYTLDLLNDEGDSVLRFWDTWFLEQNGLAAMGRTCGIEKASGDWDYNLIRTPETPLTEEELHYASRDVQVIPAYLRWTLEANEFLSPNELGVRTITKSSIVRRMAEDKFGKLRYTQENGKKMPLLRAFEVTCAQELPTTYDSYAIRKACFRGGLTFTAAKTCTQIVHNVTSLDVVSMHHTFINGRRVPVHFMPKKPWELQLWVNQVCTTDTEYVLEHYDMPFQYAFHAKLRFTNIRTKANSAFEQYGIGIIPQDKFAKYTDKEFSNEHGAIAEDLIRDNGFYARAKGGVFCLAKLVKADICEIFVNEIELWCIAQAYDFDKVEVMFGEGTSKTIIPPDYVTLQSNMLFELKDEVKALTKHYSEGTPYTGDISSNVPEGIACGLRNGTLTNDFLQSYYRATVKGSFNGIYGTQAMDLFRPDYTCTDGEIHINKETGVTPSTFAEKLEAIKHPRVLYTYGMRIVGGSRMHLIIAIQLLYKALGDKVQITGGDTDSVKMAMQEGMQDSEITKVLTPLHIATKDAIDKVQRRVRALYPQFTSMFPHLGEFEIENENEHYKEHVELWNKARVSYDGKHVHVTCAGLSRPSGRYHIEHFIEEYIARGYTFSEVIKVALGYNVKVDNAICHSLERYRPMAKDMIDDYITDYLGNTTYVNCRQSIALYPASRLLGDPTKPDNASTLSYLKNNGIIVDSRLRTLYLADGKASIEIEREFGEFERWI